ncbi:energy-coupling factor ABC transporter ATP-binding protein [Crassaminicella thermophila]|nr:ABC transporter ATP-binding protein [Crassaminicella thermophila]
MVVEMNQVTFSYDKKDPVIKELSLKIYEGDRLGIVGPNGAGKTTLFFLMAGVEKPNYGNVYLFGEKVLHKRFYPQLGMVFQNTDDQLFHPSVWDDIAFGPRNMGLSEDMVRNRVEDALKILEISYLKDRLIHQLSGGEKRLVSIAGILAMGSDFVIYDEPTSNLDMYHRRKLIDFLKKSKEKALIVASHDLEFVLEVCNRVIIFDKGCIVADGAPKDILSNKVLMEKHSLEVPYSLR